MSESKLLYSKLQATNDLQYFCLWPTLLFHLQPFASTVLGTCLHARVPERLVLAVDHTSVTSPYKHNLRAG